MSIPLIPALRKADLWELEVSQGYIVILDTLSQKIDSPLCLWDAIIPQYDSYHKKKTAKLSWLLSQLQCNK